MKLLTLNFVSCAAKKCAASQDSFPLRCEEAQLEQVELEFNPAFLQNVLPRLEWPALIQTAKELGFESLPAEKPEITDLEEQEQVLRDLHTLLLETQVQEGRLVCRNCSHPYPVKEGIANFLLPPHLVQ